MKKYLLFIIYLSISSCNSEDENLSIPTEFTFEYNLHESLPSNWVSDFNIIMENLNQIIPIKASSYFYELPIYAWNSDVNKPFKDKIGNATGASISGNGEKINGKYMVLEIPYQEFEWESMHRYSVIAHEYFHVYQMLSKNFFDDEIELKWLAEGGASSFESLYIQQYYSYNYFKMDQNRVDIAATNNPTIFETYDASKTQDSNYSSSVFMVLCLVKELKKVGFTEENAFKAIYNDFWVKDPKDNNWKNIFQEVFTFSVDQFYQSLTNYTNDINTVLPNENLKLQNIFSE